MMICKQLLGVQKQTTNYGVLLELGKIPLCTSATKFAIKNWERIRLGEGNPILLESYKCGETSWDTSIRTSLENNGMLNFYFDNYGKTYPFVHKKVFERLSDNFYQTAFGWINEDSSKLRTYATFKTEIGMEKYLVDVRNFSIRSHVTKFRLSNHRLAIETGRHTTPKTPKEQRFCQFCPGKVEDEYHFLFDCKIVRESCRKYAQI